MGFGGYPMKRLLPMLAVVLMGSAAVQAESASFTRANIALHLTHPPAKNTLSYICQNESPNTLNIPCSSYVVDGVIGTPYSMYLVVAGMDPADTSEALGQGILGVTLGILYNGAISTGIDVTSWTSCADLEFPNEWPNSGGGNVLTWVSCTGTVIDPDGVHAVVGAFSVYAYSGDFFRITPNVKLGVPSLAAADCSGAQWEISPARTARVNFENISYLGCNPCIWGTCMDDPVLPVTWGKVKSKYGH